MRSFSQIKIQMEDIVKNGLKLTNSLYSDLGMNSRGWQARLIFNNFSLGVYVFRHPDLMVAHPFFRGQVVKGVCFKFAALS